MVILGDCVEEMKKLDENSIDSIVCDPPYGLKFMSKEFDNLGEGAQQREWHKKWAVEALRVLKPGGHLLAFGGTRTYHHLATGLEEAGFEIRDQLQWLYGSGFPKSHNISKAFDKAADKKGKKIGEKKFGKTSTGQTSGWNNNQIAKAGKQEVFASATKEAIKWEGWGTALKPANEPIVLARKPFKGTVVENIQEHGTGAINIDGCRVGSETTLTTNGKGFAGSFKGGKNNQGGKETEGRWPANVILDEEAGALLDEQSGMKEGASRFFYCPKAAKKERNAGLDGFEEKQQDTGRKKGNPGGDNPRNRGVHKRANFHPTVKPVALIAYLCRLITPPNGTILDPFLGSGSTGIAAIQEGFNFVGIEKDPEYMKIAKARIEYWKGEIENDK
jgi:DNA modification methylase